MFAFSQLTPKVDSLYKRIYATDQVQNGIIGMVGSISYPDYDNLFTELDSIATDDEVLYIASKGNKVIKYHMNQILVDRKSKHLADLFKYYIFNNEEIYVQGGCTGNQSSLAGELYNYTFYQKRKIENVNYNIEHFTSTELKEFNLELTTSWTKPEVDSLLTLLNKTALSNNAVLPITLREIFALNNFKFENYKRIKYFAQKYPEEEILATLATFQNRKDLALLQQNIDKAYIAISKFPDISFIPSLVARIDLFNKDYYYLDAAASLCTKEAEELQTLIVEKFENLRNTKTGLLFGDGELYDHFYNCLEKKNCSLNDSFLVKLWLNHKVISFTFFQKIKEKQYGNLLKGFIKNIPITSAPINQESDWQHYSEEQLNGDLCPQILEYLKSNSQLNIDQSIDLEALHCNAN